MGTITYLESFIGFRFDTHSVCDQPFAVTFSLENFIKVSDNSAGRKLILNYTEILLYSLI